jgi:N-acetylglucosamine repressor
LGRVGAVSPTNGAGVARTHAKRVRRRYGSLPPPQLCGLGSNNVSFRRSSPRIPVPDVKLASSKIQPRLLRQLNQQQVLTAIRSRGPLSRAEISRHTGVSFPTVTRAVASLIEARLLEEEDQPQQTSIGRPGRLVRLARTEVSVLGCVVDAGMCEVAVAGLDGEVLPDAMRQFPTPATYKELVNACVDQLRRLLKQRKTTALSLGVSVPGLLNRHEGRSLLAPNLRQINGQSLGIDFGKRLGLETVVLQECDALCLAEKIYGAAKGVADFAMLDISEGLGLGVMHGDKLLQGHSGFAGEFGHITVELNGRECGCGNHGCLETVATDAALVNLVSERTGRRWKTDELLAAIRSGSLDAGPELERTVQYLAVGVAAVLNIFNPQRLFIYGRFLDAAEQLFPRLLELVERRALAPNRADCEIVRAQGNKRQGAIAAAIQAATDAHHGR